MLAWLVAEDDGAKSSIVEKLAGRDQGLDILKQSLQGSCLPIFPDLTNNSPAQINGITNDKDDSIADMLSTLLAFLA